MNQSLTIRAPKKMIDILNEVAIETDRNKSYHIIKAIEYYINEYADLRIALDRLNDNTEPTMSMEEMKKALEL